MSNFESFIILHFKTNQYIKNNKKQKTESFNVIETSWLKFTIETQKKSDKKTIAIVPNSKNKKVSEEFEIVETFIESLDIFEKFLKEEKSKFIIITESSWHIDKCCSKELYLKKKEIPNHFINFFDLRKEFSKLFNLNFNLFKMMDYLELKNGLLLSGAEYCESMSNVIIKLLEKGHIFENPERSILSSDSSIVKLRGLPWQVTESDIIEFFSPLKISEILLVLSTQGNSTGEAFVSFNSIETAKNCFLKDNCYIGYRYIEIFPSSLEELNQSKSMMKKSIERSKSFVIKMRGLPFICSIEDILHFFDGIDIIEDGIHLSLNESFKPNGIAYVEFPTNETFNEALKRNKERMGKRYVELFRSTKEEMLQSQYSTPQFTPFIIKLENVPKEYDEIYLAEIFSDFNISPQGIHLVFDHLNEFTGEAFIEFLTIEDVKNSLKKEYENEMKIKESSGFEFLIACGLIDSIPSNSGKFTPNSTKSLIMNGIKKKIKKEDIFKYFQNFELQKDGIEFLEDGNR
eukprot:gene8958-907_t